MSGSGTESAFFSGTDALLFVAICLLIGVFTRSFLKLIPLPYTVLLLVRTTWAQPCMVELHVAANHQQPGT